MFSLRQSKIWKAVRVNIKQYMQMKEYVEVPASSFLHAELINITVTKWRAHRSASSLLSILFFAVRMHMLDIETILPSKITAKD